MSTIFSRLEPRPLGIPSCPVMHFSERIREVDHLGKVGDTPVFGSAKFDETITSVNQFEMLRYPDEMLAHGAEIRLDWVRFTPCALALHSVRDTACGCDSLG